jgi:hypothetical protein
MFSRNLNCPTLQRVPVTVILKSNNLESSHPFYNTLRTVVTIQPWTIPPVILHVPGHSRTKSSILTRFPTSPWTPVSKCPYMSTCICTWGIYPPQLHANDIRTSLRTYVPAYLHVFTPRHVREHRWDTTARFTHRNCHTQPCAWLVAPNMPIKFLT